MWQTRGCFCHILVNCGGGPRGCSKVEVKPCTKVLSCVGWHRDREAGISLKGRLYETPPSVSPHAIIYLSMSLHFDTLMGCPRDTKPSSSGQRSPCWQFWLLPSISWMAWAARWSWQWPLVLAPAFSFTSFVSSNIMTELEIQICSRLVACGSRLRWWDSTKIKKKPSANKEWKCMKCKWKATLLTCGQGGCDIVR